MSDFMKDIAAQAKLMLKAGYGFSDEDASVWLTNEENLSKKKTLTMSKCLTL